MLGALSQTDMKEVKGLEERLSGLEQLMQSAVKIVDDQVEMSQVSHVHSSTLHLNQSEHPVYLSDCRSKCSD